MVFSYGQQTVQTGRPVLSFNIRNEVHLKTLKKVSVSKGS